MKPLRFIHVSKTGGQAIATVARDQALIYWGMFDDDYGTGRNCHHLLSHANKKEIIPAHDWFMAVRNPYQRMISMYAWYKKWPKITSSFDEFLEEHLAFVGSEQSNKGDHFTPQYLYLEKGFDITVLRFENLEQEFNDLMKSRGYSIVLDKKVNESNNKLTISDLSKKSIDLINRVYEKDFITFGYDMIH